MAATSAKRTEIIRNEIRDYHRHTRERAVVKGEERDSTVVPTIPRARSCGRAPILEHASDGQKSIILDLIKNRTVFHLNDVVC